MNFLNLPSEIILMIFSNVTGKDLAILRLTSKDTKGIIDGNDFLWSIIGRKEFNIEKCSNYLCCTPEFFYKHFLYKYGNLVGLWTHWIIRKGPSHLDYLVTTGMSKIILTGNGLTFYSLENTQHIEKTIVFEAYLTIDINGNDLISVKCLNDNPDSHNGEIEIISDDQMIITSSNSFRKTKDDYSMTRFVPRSCQSNNIIKSGIFMNCESRLFVSLEYRYHDKDYESHEIIIRDLRFSQMMTIISKVNLARPMIINELQQEYIANLKDIGTQALPPGMTIHTMPKQPFIVPIDCTDQNEFISHSVPYHCKARFHSEGTCSSSPSHFIIFDNDTFGDILFTRKSLILFKRVDNI